MSSDPLLQPFQLKRLALRNRLHVAPPTSRPIPRTGVPKARYRLYHAKRAKGGVALTMIGGSSVESRPTARRRSAISSFTRTSVVRWLEERADDVRAPWRRR